MLLLYISIPQPEGTRVILQTGALAVVNAPYTVSMSRGIVCVAKTVAIPVHLAVNSLSCRMRLANKKVTLRSEYGRAVIIS